MRALRIAESGDSARDFVPTTKSLAALREAAVGCKGCPLWKLGTQTVFGDGPRTASLVLVGEQPGDEEDRRGKPFVGPAGRLLDRALEDAGIDRRVTYVTNVVKHFKWTPKGSRRLHQKPNTREIGACLPWLEAEIDLLRPKVLVLLGATAAQAVLGAKFRVTASRGQIVSSRLVPVTIATVHPSSLLRLPPEADREVEMARFVSDLEVAAAQLAKAG